MSYGDKYIIKYVDRYGYNTVHTIAQDGYSGGTSYLTGSDEPVSYILDSQVDSKFVPIKGTLAEVTFYDADGSHFTEFISSRWATYRLTTTKSGGVNPIMKCAYSVPDSYKEPYTMNPYPITLTFSDQLGRLKTLFFTANQDSGPPEQPYIQYSGYWSHLDLIHLCLSQITDFSNPLNLYESLDVFSSGMDQSTYDKSPLNQAWNDVSKYYSDSGDPVTFYDVLSEICTHYGAQLFYDNDGWVLRRVASVADAVSQRKWTATGSKDAGYNIIYQSVNTVYFKVSNTVNNVALTSRNRMVGHILTVIPALKRLSVVHNYGQRTSILQNYSFDSYVRYPSFSLDYAAFPANNQMFYASRFTNWSAVNNVPSLFTIHAMPFNYTGEAPLVKYLEFFEHYFRGRLERGIDFQSIEQGLKIPLLSTLPGFYNITNSAVLLVAGDGGETSWPVESVGPYYLNNGVNCRIESDPVTLLGNQTVNISFDYMIFANGLPVSSLTGDCVVQVMFKNMTSGNIGSLRQDNMIWDEGNVWNCIRINLDIHLTGTTLTLPTSPQTFSTTTKMLPNANCKIWIRLYSLMQSVTNGPNFNHGPGFFSGILFNNIILMPQILGAKSIKLETRVENLNQSVQSLTLNLGDAPSGGYNAGLIYKNVVFENSLGTQLSSTWDFRGGSNALPHLWWISNEYKQQMTNPSEIIGVDIHAGTGMFDFGRVILEKDNSNKAFIILRGDYKDKSGVFAGEIVRVFSNADNQDSLIDDLGNTLVDERGNTLIS